MRKHSFIYLLLCICLVLCACQKAQEAPTEISVVLEISATEPVKETTAETTELTVPTTEPPRVIGPHLIEGNAVTIENVSVEYLNELPRNIKSSTT